MDLDPKERVKAYIKAASVLDALERIYPRREKAVYETREKIDELKRHLSRYSDVLDQVFVERLAELEIGFEPVEQEYQDRWGHQTAALLAAKGMSLVGRYPKFTADVFTVELVGRKSFIWFGPKQQRLGEAKSAPEEVVSQIVRLRKHLEGGLQGDLLAHLKHTYDYVLNTSESPQDGRVPIVLFLQFLTFQLSRSDRNFQIDPTRANYTVYNRLQFSYDLFGLRHHSSVQLTPAVRQYTANEKDYLWILDEDHTIKGREYSHIMVKD